MAASGRPFLQVEAQKLQQAHYLISIRSALRVISDSLAAPGFALLNAADRLMSGKSAATVTSDQRILCLHCRSAAASVQSGDGRFATLNRMQRLSCGTPSQKLASANLGHQAAFCVNGLRNQRSLTQKGFELSSEQLACSKGLYSMPI